MTVCLGALVPDAAPQARNTSPRIKVMHYNICGAAHLCSGKEGNKGAYGPGSSIARVVGEAVAHTPDVISLNEICHSQYTALMRRLRAAGYVMDGTYASSQNNVVNCGTDQRYGSAVLSRQDVADDVQEYHAFRNTADETYTNGGRSVKVERGLLCANTWFAGRPLKACTAHANGKAPEQMREIRDWVEDPSLFPPDIAVVIAGDMNLRPDSPAMADLYGHAHVLRDAAEPPGRFVEADEEDRGTVPGGQKIDYVFADRRHFTEPGAVVEKFDESDHALYRASFTLVPTARTGA
ncbi:endonuclease/exonuclease/phosphatase family protein [Streptomyces sp. NPDC002536]